MALINCWECGTQISTEAAACPKCGAPKKLESVPPVTYPSLIDRSVAAPSALSPSPVRPKQNDSLRKILFGAIVVVVLGLIISISMSRELSSGRSQTLDDAYAAHKKYRLTLVDPRERRQEGDSVLKAIPIDKVPSLSMGSLLLALVAVEHGSPTPTRDAWLAVAQRQLKRYESELLTIGPNGASLPGKTEISSERLGRKTVMRARRQFKVEVLSFDASQQYGSEFPYSDRVRLKITNKSDVTLPCLTILTKRYVGREMVGSSRAPSIATRDIAPGESVEYEYYPRGHLDVVKVDKIAAEVEDVVAADEEQFICELESVNSQASSMPEKRVSALERRIKVGTPADSVLAWLGKANSVLQTGEDAQGLLVEWRHSNAVYLMGRRVRDGVEAYRVIKITPAQ